MRHEWGETTQLVGVGRKSRITFEQREVLRKELEELFETMSEQCHRYRVRKDKKSDLTVDLLPFWVHTKVT